MIKTRSPVLAVILNVLFFGLGFVYVGRFVYGIILLLSAMVLVLGLALTKLIFVPQALYSAVAIAVLVWIGALVWVGKLAKRHGEAELKWYQRWYIYVAFAVVSSLISNSMHVFRGPVFGYESYRVPSQAMTPTLLAGDFILVDTAVYRDENPKRGDVIVFWYPEDPDIAFIKRVIGVPGDAIRYEDKKLHVNGNPVEAKALGTYSGVGGVESMTGLSVVEEHLDGARYRVVVIPDIKAKDSQSVVPEGHFYVLGDHRDNSRDSRYWGFVPADHLIGRVRAVWMSWAWGHGINFSRFGRPIE